MNHQFPFSSKHWGNSLRYLSFDKKEELSPSEALISDTIHEWYDAKHRSFSNKEVDLVNSHEVSICPRCKSSSFIKYGNDKNGIQRYKCKDCSFAFTPLNNTIFEDRKIPISEWIEYLIHLFEFHSLTTSSRDNRNASSTGKYWLIKVFEVLKHYQDDIVLEGTITLDETFFTVTQRKKKTKEDGKEYRGISRNKLCVLAAYDDHNHILLLFENTSKPSLSSTWKTIGNHIKEGSTLIHDKEKSHKVLVDNLNLVSRAYGADELNKLSDEENPLRIINTIHYLAKRFMNAHGGYNRDNIQDWMNLICFILSKPIDRYEKIDLFINMALNSPIRVKYRSVMCKKHTK